MRRTGHCDRRNLRLGESDFVSVVGVTDEYPDRACGMPACHFPRCGEFLISCRQSDWKVRFMTKSVLDYLEESARLRPGSDAVVDEHGRHTYEKLCDDAKRIGSALAERGACGHGVVVCMEKGYDALVAQLGSLYAGAYYVPVSPEVTEKRFHAVCSALGSPVVVADDMTASRLGEFPFDVRIVPFADIAGHSVDREALDVARGSVDDGSPVYVLFTSGSTGFEFVAFLAETF